MKRVFLSLMVGCACIFSGCTFYRVDSRDVSADFHTPKDSMDSVVYVEKLDKPFEVIGIVTVTTQRASSREDVLARIRYESAMLGADAFTDIVSDNAPVQVNYTAKAVVFK